MSADKNFLELIRREVDGNEPRRVPFQIEKFAHMCLVALDLDKREWVRPHPSRYLIGNGEEYIDQLCVDPDLPDYVREYGHESVSEMMGMGRAYAAKGGVINATDFEVQPENVYVRPGRNVRSHERLLCGRTVGLSRPLQNHFCGI